MRNAFYLLLLSVLIAGCAHRYTPVVRTGVSDAAVELKALLGELAANEAAIARFRATGCFTLKSPELEAIYHLPQSSFSFVRPDRLTVVGRKYATTVLRLWCEGRSFLLALPTERQFVYRPEGAVLEGLGGRVSPVDILGEMFFAERWDRLDAARVKLVRYDAAGQEAVFEVYGAGRGGALERRVWAVGPPWVVARCERYGADGAVVAVTEKRDWREVSGVRFPMRIESVFPTEAAEMRFETRKVFVNEAGEEARVDVAEEARKLREKGYAEASLE